MTKEELIKLIKEQGLQENSPEAFEGPVDEELAKELKEEPDTYSWNGETAKNIPLLNGVLEELIDQLGIDRECYEVKKGFIIDKEDKCEDTNKYWLYYDAESDTVDIINTNSDGWWSVFGRLAA